MAEQALTTMRSFRKRGTVEQIGLGRGARWKLGGEVYASISTPTHFQIGAEPRDTGSMPTLVHGSLIEPPMLL